MSAIISVSETSMQVVAKSATDLVAGAQLAGAAHVAKNVRRVGEVLHADMQHLEATVGTGLGNLQVISGLNLAVSAAGFAVVAHQLHAARGDLRALHADMRSQGEALLRAQDVVAVRIESLTEMATRSLHVQEKILDALLKSRTVEAEQLIRQGWANLGNGYLPEAEERFRVALQHDNTHALAHGALGEIAAMAGDRAKAEDHLLRSVRFAGPEHAAEARRRFAAYLEREGRPDEALREWDALGASSARDLFHMSEVAARAGRTDRALDSALRAIDADPGVFVAVLGSDALAALEPERTKRVMAMDSARREAVLDVLGQACEPLETTDRLISYTEASTRSDVRLAGARIAAERTGLRQRGEAILSRVLTEAFGILDAALDDAVALAIDAGRFAEESVGQVIGAIQAPVYATSAALERTRTSSVLGDALSPAAASNLRAISALLPWKRKDTSESRARPALSGAAVEAAELRRCAVADATDELRNARAMTGIAAFAHAAETCGSAGPLQRPR